MSELHLAVIYVRVGTVNVAVQSEEDFRKLKAHLAHFRELEAEVARLRQAAADKQAVHEALINELSGGA